MFKLLYKTGKSKKEFSKLEWIKELRKEDEEISPFFQENLKNIFPELKLFNFETSGQKTTKYPLKKVKKILDAICWYPKGQFFVILEYKSKKPPEIMKQVRGYLEAISDGENRDCIVLLKTLNKQFPKEKEIPWEYEEIDWNGTRLIWISPKLPKEKWYYSFGDVIWVESEWYKSNDSEIAIRLSSDDRDGLLEQLSQKEEVKPIKPKIENLSQFLQQKKISKKEVEKWIEKIDKFAMKKFLLNATYYPMSIFYKKNKSSIFWIWNISKSSLTVYFSPKTEKVLESLSKKHKLLTKPKMYWTIKIKNENSFLESLQIIKEILEKRKHKNE